MSQTVEQMIQASDTKITNINNYVESLHTVFSSEGGGANAELSTLEASVKSFASNANNISAGVLGTTYGGTGRSDGMVTDVYLGDNWNAKKYGQLGYASTLNNSLPLRLEDMRMPGNYFYYRGSYMEGDTIPHTHVNAGVITVRNFYGDAYQLIMDSWMNVYLSKSGSSENLRTVPLTELYGGNPTIYISSTGNDDNDGFKIDKPIQSIDRLKHILKGLVATGEIYICFDEGDWGNLDLISLNRRIVIQKHPNATSNPKFNQLSIIGLTRLVSIDTNILYVYIGNVYISGSQTIGVMHLRNSVVESNNGSIVFTGSTTTNNIVYLRDSELILTGNGSYSLSLVENCPATVFADGSGSIICSSKITGNFTGIKSGYGVKVTTTNAYDNIPGEPYTNNQRTYSICPLKNNFYSVGNSSERYTEVFAMTGSINVSDARYKSNVSSMDDALYNALSKINFKQFQFNDAVSKKGSDARIHFGVIAQDIAQIFSANGLDASKYGFFCYDKWNAVNETKHIVEVPARYEKQWIIDEIREYDADGNLLHDERGHWENVLVQEEISYDVTETKEAGDMYSIRYEELLCLEAAYQRERANRLEARLAALEAKVK